ncbi:MAG: sulfotransferase domain-containing protein [Caulobacteraceae bacterium]
MLSHAPTRQVRDWHSDSSRWDAYTPRAGDIVIGTAAKVGTTWTQQIVNLLVFQSAQARPLGMLSPWLDSRFMAPLEVVLPMLEAQTHRRFIKTHLPMDAFPLHEEVRYIHTARDGRDAAMSYFNHLHSHTEEAWERFDAIGLEDPTIGRPMPRPQATAAEFFHHWVRAPEAHMADWFFTLEDTYWRHRRETNVLLVHFNDLSADLDGEMRRISAFLDIPVNEAVWPSLVEAATFGAMKRDGDSLLAGMERGFKGGHRSFLHSGANGRWQGVVEAADLALYHQKMEAALTPALIKWLEEGRAGAGDPRLAED